MTNIGRSLSILPLFFTLACGGDPAPKPVADLPDADAKALCQQFFAAACKAYLLLSSDPACTTCEPCTQANSLTTIRSACGNGITDAAVRHCVSSGFDMPTCTGSERGGCMFDVGDALCPPTAQH